MSDSDEYMPDSVVDDRDNSISVELAVQTAPRFGISEKEAYVYAKEISAIVKDNWEKLAKGYDLSRNQIENMRPAFNGMTRGRTGVVGHIKQV